MRPGLALTAFAVLATSGCGGPNAPSCADEGEGACRIDSALVDGKTRTYVVSHREALDCSHGKVPVIFAFHGYADTGSGLRSYLGLEAELANRALVVYPDGLPRGDTVGQSGWNRDPQGDDLKFFDQMVAKLAEDDCLDTSKVFATGHSRGGRMVEALSCYRGDVARGFAIVAGGTDDLSGCDGRGPVWMTHGIHDGVVPFSEGEADRNRFAARNGCDDPKQTSFTVDACTPLTGCSTGEEVVWCPSTASKWNGHAPADFVPAEMTAFLTRYF